jgi:large subunit ribosomal protein L9
MKVILLRDIAKLGKRGEIKEVATVYAINVLLKKQEAIEATPGEIAKWKQKEETQKHKKETATSAFLELINKLRSGKVTIEGKKADAKGQLFARVQEGEIADAIYKTSNMSVNPKQILLENPIKSLGLHEIFLKQGTQKEKVIVEIK